MAFDINKIARLTPAELMGSGGDAASGFSRGFNGDPDPRRRASANPTPDDWKPVVAETRAAQPERDEEARRGHGTFGTRLQAAVHRHRLRAVLAQMDRMQPAVAP